MYAFLNYCVIARKFIPILYQELRSACRREDAVRGDLTRLLRGACRGARNDHKSFSSCPHP